MQAAAENTIEHLTYEKVQEFDFLHHCFYESLSIEPPVPVSSNQIFDRDVVIKNFTLKAGEPFWIYIKAMHHDETKW